jgi:hypothetical protein
MGSGVGLIPEIFYACFVPISVVMFGGRLSSATWLWREFSDLELDCAALTAALWDEAADRSTKLVPDLTETRIAIGPDSKSLGVAMALLERPLPVLVIGGHV